MGRVWFCFNPLTSQGIKSVLFTYTSEGLLFSNYYKLFGDYTETNKVYREKGRVEILKA